MSHSKPCIDICAKFSLSTPWTHTVPLINFSTRWRWVANFTPRPLYPRERAPALNEEAEWAPEPVGLNVWRREKSLVPTGIRTRTLQVIALLTVMTTLLWLLDMWGRRGIAPPFLTLTLEGSDRSASHPGHFTSGVKSCRYQEDKRLGRMYNRSGRFGEKENLFNRFMKNQLHSSCINQYMWSNLLLIGKWQNVWATVSHCEACSRPWSFHVLTNVTALYLHYHESDELHL
jgi:hypothetical protein